MTMKVTDIEIKKIKTRDNSRVKIDKDELGALMASIKQNGLIQPIQVTPEGRGKFLVICGHRRLEAFRKLSAVSRTFKKIPAIVTTGIDSRPQLVMNLVENVQRKDLNQAEQGRYFDALMKDFKMSLKEISAATGMPLPRVKHALTTYNMLPEEWRKKVRPGSKAPRRGSKAPGLSPAVAVKAANIAKAHGLGRRGLDRLLSYVEKTGATTEVMTELNALLARGYSVADAKRLASDVQVVAIRVPISKKNVSSLEKQYDSSIHDIILMSLEADPELKIYREARSGKPEPKVSSRETFTAPVVQ